MPSMLRAIGGHGPFLCRDKTSGLRTGTTYANTGGSRTFTSGGSRLFEFEQTGKFVREVGAGLYGLLFAQAVRVDSQDNIWLIDRGSICRRGTDELASAKAELALECISSVQLAGSAGLSPHKKGVRPANSP